MNLQRDQIEKAFGHVKDEVNDAILELGYIDFDEVISDSDASDYRDEEAYQDIDNRIINRLDR